MKSHAKAVSAGSTSSRGTGLGSSVRGALATRASSLDTDGSGAPSRARTRIATLALAISALALLALAPSALATPGRALNSSASFASTTPGALAVDQSSGDVYVVDPAHQQIRRYDASGASAPFSSLSGSNVLDGSGGADATPDGSFDFDLSSQVTVDNSGTATNGDIYVADSGGSFGGGHNVIDIFSSAGDYLGQINGAGTSEGNWATGGTYPCGVAVGADGSLYVAVAFNSIDRYSPASGAVMANSDFNAEMTNTYGCGIAADSSGNVYETQNAFGGAGALTKYSPSDFGTDAPAGTPIVSDPLVTAVNVDPSSDDIYADEGDSIHVFDSTGAAFYTFGSSADLGATPSDGVAVKGDKGSAYVADLTHNKVDVYPLQARPYDSSFASTTPGALAVDQSSGDVYVVDPAHQQIRRYDASGASAPFSSLSGSNVLDGSGGADATPDGSFDFDLSSQVTVDNSGTATNGDIYVADSGGSFGGGHNVIDIFSSAGDYLGQINGAGTSKGNWATGGTYPCGVAVGADGSLYVAVAFNSIDRYSPASGAVMANSDFNAEMTNTYGCGIAADSSGNVYETQNAFGGAGALTKYSPSDFGTDAPAGTPIVSDPLVTAVNVDPSSDDIYADEGDSIHVFDSTGAAFYTLVPPLTSEPPQTGSR